MRGAHLALIAGAALVLGCEMASAQTSTTFRLDNGLEVIAVEDRRAPIATHFIGYRSGGADDPQGRSGLAHFVEHLMFSATPASQGPAFGAAIARLGGRSNAVTGHDATLYHARVPKEHLRLVMEREAARMTHLEITERQVAAEREVILAERRSRIDSRPFAVLIERADALLGAPHYGRPSIGIASEIAGIDAPAAAEFHRRHYAPGNAFVVVVGDVSADAVRDLAADTYGRVPADRADGDATRGARHGRPPDMGHAAGRTQRVVLREPRAQSATLYRAYRVPGYRAARGGEGKGEAMELLSAILTSGGSSRLAARLMGTTPSAAVVDGGYLGVRRHDGQLAIYVVAASGADLGVIEDGIDGAIREIAERPPGAEEIDGARRTLVNQQAFRADDQFLLAQIYAEGLGAGLTAGHVESFADRLARVGPEEIRAAAILIRDEAHAVTGLLLPPVEPTKGSLP